MTRCTRCLYPNTKPDLEFDARGVCSACRSYDKRDNIDWDARRRKLLELLDAHNGRCIVASSGGKDSTAIALHLHYLGADVTAVTAATCHPTAIGQANIANLARYVDTVEVMPNRTVRRALNRLGLRLVGDISWPEHVAIFTTPFRVAAELGVDLIFYGENPQEAYGGPDGSDAAFELNARWRAEFGGFLGLRPSDMVGQEGLTQRDMLPYTLPASGNAKAYFLGQFRRWDSHANADIAIDHGFRFVRPSQASWWPWENQDNAQTGLHDYMMLRKYGYGRGCAQISVDVRAGNISRVDALEWVRKHDALFPYPYIDVSYSAIAEHIGMDCKEIDRCIGRFTACSPVA